MTDNKSAALAAMIEDTKRFADTSGQTFTAHLLDLAQQSLAGDTTEIDLKTREMLKRKR